MVVSNALYSFNFNFKLDHLHRNLYRLCRILHSRDFHSGTPTPKKRNLNNTIGTSNIEISKNYLIVIFHESFAC